jgi:hypothetical protein
MKKRYKLRVTFEVDVHDGAPRPITIESFAKAFPKLFADFREATVLMLHVVEVKTRANTN